MRNAGQLNLLQVFVVQFVAFRFTPEVFGYGHQVVQAGAFGSHFAQLSQHVLEVLGPVMPEYHGQATRAAVHGCSLFNVGKPVHQSVRTHFTAKGGLEEIFHGFGEGYARAGAEGVAFRASTVRPY
jgi:hypothetical protein